jgi:macrolide-specific efflux system membrane fusion protein
MDNNSTTAGQDFGAQFLRNRRERRQRRIIAAVAVVAVLGGIYYWQTRPVADPNADQVLYATIGYGNIENAIPAAGTLQPKEVVPVGAQASGKLVEILVELGDMVQEGQLLARIDASEQELRVQNSELSLENQRNQIPQRELDVEIAQNNLERARILRDAEASTPQEYENAEKALLSAETGLANLRIQIRQSETSLQQEKVQLEYTNITAPLSGTIIEITQKEGATLNASQTAPTVMQIADLRTLTVQTEISEADIAQVETGVEVYFTTMSSADRRWYSTLRQKDPMPANSNNVVLYKGSFDIDNSDGELYPGMTTQVFFVTSSAENVLTVPLGALTFTSAPGATMSGRQGGRGGEGARGAEGAQNREDMAARMEQFRANGGEITPEMRQRMEQFRANGGGEGFAGGGGRSFGGGGNFPSGGYPGGGAAPGGPGAGSAAAGGAEGEAAEAPPPPRLAAAIALNQPRNATVQLVQEDGTTVAREVVVGASDRVNAEIISGLVEGDRVVAGVVQAKVEEEENNNNNNNQWRGGGGFPGGGGFRPF